MLSILRRKKFLCYTYAKLYLTWSSHCRISTSHREELMHFYLLNLNHQSKKMLYYYVVYPLTHVDSISELQSKYLWQLSNILYIKSFVQIIFKSNIYRICQKHLSNHCQKHLSNQCQTSIEPLSNVYRTTFNLNYTHWVPWKPQFVKSRSFRISDLFFFFEQTFVERFNRTLNVETVHTRKLLITYSSICNAAFSIFF